MQRTMVFIYLSALFLIFTLCCIGINAEKEPLRMEIRQRLRSADELQELWEKSGGKASPTSKLYSPNYSGLLFIVDFNYIRL